MGEPRGGSSRCRGDLRTADCGTYVVGVRRRCLGLDLPRPMLPRVITSKPATGSGPLSQSTDVTAAPRLAAAGKVDILVHPVKLHTYRIPGVSRLVSLPFPPRSSSLLLITVRLPPYGWECGEDPAVTRAFAPAATLSAHLRAQPEGALTLPAFPSPAEGCPGDNHSAPYHQKANHRSEEEDCSHPSSPSTRPGSFILLRKATNY